MAAPTPLSDGRAARLEVGSGLTLKTTVSAGDTLAVLSGGIASASTVNSGGVLIVSSGGIASATTISSGGSETVFGTDIGATVSAGASLTVGAGGAANNPLIKGGILDVTAGGAIGGPVTFTGTGWRIANRRLGDAGKYDFRLRQRRQHRFDIRCFRQRRQRRPGQQRRRVQSAADHRRRGHLRSATRSVTKFCCGCLPAGE